jgi:hypothetical protein
MVGSKQRHWRELCAAVTTETDSKKLDSLVQELIRAFDEDERSVRQFGAEAASFGGDPGLAHQSPRVPTNGSGLPLKPPLADRRV